MKKENNKREKILDAMQSLLADTSMQSVSVSDIAQRAGIGKGSIYYYFKSKEDILEAMIERSYSTAIEESEELVESPDLDPFTKMEVIFRACRESSMELRRQETSNYFEAQQSALIHQQFIQVLVKKLRPILADIIRQGVAEGLVHCDTADEIAELVIVVLAIKLDNHIIPSEPEEIRRFLSAFTIMLEGGMGIPAGSLDYLLQ